MTTTKLLDEHNPPPVRETWMLPGGRPGAIIAALCAAQAAAGALTKTNANGQTYVAAEDAIRVARDALTGAGIAAVPIMSRPELQPMGNANYALVHCNYRLIAADGTYVEASAPGGAAAGMGKHVQAAVTVAKKVALTAALLLSVEGADEELVAKRKDFEPSALASKLAASIGACRSFAEWTAWKAENEAELAKVRGQSRAWLKRQYDTRYQELLAAAAAGSGKRQERAKSEIVNAGRTREPGELPGWMDDDGPPPGTDLPTFGEEKRR